MTYRIITNAGTVDFAFEVETAEAKYKRYIKDMLAGYAKWVKFVAVDRTGKEVTLHEERG